MAAHTAARRGERLSADEIAPWILESDVHVVLRPESTMMAAEVFPEDPSLTRTPITRIVLAQNERPPVYDGIAPKWITTDLSYLDAIGGSPFTDAVAAAAFDAEVIAQSFGVYGFWQTGIHSIPTHGLLDANEVRTWK